ncbi:MAG: pantetheine-phosphate adenylyltransferase, partial [Pirellulaceae bacterium]
MPASDLSTRRAVYTGSFDPITLGHLDIIQRSARLYDSLIVGIGVNATKSPLFSVEERLRLVKKVVCHLENVSVEAFDGLAVDFVRKSRARVMVRGVRPLMDIAGEFTMMMANRQLDAEIETVFLMADEEFVHVSSSLIKQIAILGGGQHLGRFVPEEIIPD